jgi:hypothetical protein
MADLPNRERRNWREHLRVIAMIANVFFVVLMVGSRAWWWATPGLGVPSITYPLLAIIALGVNRRIS